LESKIHKIQFRLGLRPDPTGKLTTFPYPLGGWGGGYPFTRPLHYDAFGVSISAPLAPRNSLHWATRTIYRPPPAGFTVK